MGEVRSTLDLSASPRHRLHERHTARPDSWDRERIAAAITAWHAETGEVPRSWEWCPSSGRALGRVSGQRTKWELEHPRWPGSTTVYRYFDSWGDAVRAAGLTPRMAAPSIPLAERVDAAHRLRAEGHDLHMIAAAVGVTVPTARRYLHAHPCSVCGAPVVGGGSLCQACTTRTHNPRRWQRDELLELGLTWVHETGRLPCARDWSTALTTAADKWRREFPRWPPASTVRLEFGGWNAYRVLLGGQTYHPPWTPEQIIEAIGRWVDKHGVPPTKTAWERPPPGFPSAPTVRRRFGTWRAALQAAGTHSPKPTWTRATLISAIHRFEDEHQRPPLPADWRRAGPGAPTTATVLHHFASWEAALAAADAAR